MEEKDILETRARESAASAFSRNRADLIRFFKDLAANERPIPEKSLQAEKKDILAPARQALEKQMAGRDRADKDSTIRLALASFLFERLEKIRKVTLEKNKAGQFSLYLTLRDQVRELMGPDYFTARTDNIVSAYLDLEPLLAASSELCSLEVPRLEEIVSEFKKR